MILTDISLTLSFTNFDMKLFAPEYYKSFKCIADKCRHSCCIGWEIDIDPDTEEVYKALEDGYGEKILKSIDFDGTPHFSLTENERCPHLDSNGLCRIICELGEDYLCDICREHPRFYNYTSRGLEVGIGMSCEEACRIILDSEDFGIVELEDDREEYSSEDFDAVVFRDRVYSILKEPLPYEKRLERICREFSLSLAVLSDGEWRDVIDTLEYLYPSHRQLFSAYSSCPETDGKYEKQLERALAYFVFRHCDSAIDYDGFRARLGFALFCERLLSSLISTGADVYESARIISEELEYSEDNTWDVVNLFNTAL